jgi:hypothetical protein
MSAEISFCPLCAGKLDSSDDAQFICEDCETQFLIEVIEEGDDDEEEEDEDEEEEEEDEERESDEDEDEDEQF